MGLRLRGRRLQSGETAQAHDGAGMNGPLFGEIAVEPLEDGSIEFAKNDDGIVLNAKPDISSTAC